MFNPVRIGRELTPLFVDSVTYGRNRSFPYRALGVGGTEMVRRATETWRSSLSRSCHRGGAVKLLVPQVNHAGMTPVLPEKKRSPAPVNSEQKEVGIDSTAWIFQGCCAGDAVQKETCP